MAATAVIARQPASMMARVDRLDLLLGYLEEMQMHRNGNGNGNASPPSVTTASSPSTPAAGAGGHHRGLVSSDDDDDDSSAASTPRAGSKTWQRRPRPAKEVLEEARTKGSLIDRIAFLEHRVLKMEEEGMVITPADKEKTSHHQQQQPKAMFGGYVYGHVDSSKENPSSRKKKKKGIKSLVKSCVRGNLKTKD